MNLDEAHRKITFWSSPDKEEKLEAYREKVIGAGTFGRCELIRDIHTGKYFCLKACRLTQFDVLSSAVVEFEKSINFSHKNLVCAYFSWYDGAGQLQLITEYCQLGSINQVLDTQTLDATQRIGLANAVVVQVNRALAYLKQQTPPIFHRDIKFENVLIDANGVIKLADLGLAATHDSGQTHTQGAGTPRWLAPEVLHGREYDYPSDQYSLALVVLRILRGVIKNDGTIDVPTECHEPLLMEYLEQQLEVDPTKRMTAEEVLEMFKGRGTSLRGVIKLPPGKEKLISPNDIPWQTTTEAERRANDELRRLAVMFTQSLDEEKDITVLADVLKLLPFVGSWMTRKGITIQRTIDGAIMFPSGALGPSAPQTPFKAAYIRNVHGRDKKDEDEESIADGSAPLARRLASRDLHEDAGDGALAPTKKLTLQAPGRRRSQFLSFAEEPSTKISAVGRASAKRGSDAAHPPRRGRRSEAEENEDEEDDVHATKKITSKKAPANRGRPKRARAVDYAESDDDGDDHDESADEEEEDMRDDEDGPTSEFSESSADEKSQSGSERPRNGRRGSKLAVAPTIAPAKRSTRARQEEPKKRVQPRRRATDTSLNGTTELTSIEQEKDSWDTFSVEEKVDKILACEEWHASFEEWSKLRRIGVPENEQALRRLLLSLLETDLGEREWLKANNNTGFAKKSWDWVVDHHQLWREAGRAKRRKRN